MALRTFSRTHQPLEPDDALYIAWIYDNTDGYILAFTLPDEYYVTVHRSSCTHVTRQRSVGAYTRGNYGKHCAETWQDVEEFFAKPRARVEECGTCRPIPFDYKNRQNNSTRNKY